MSSEALLGLDAVSAGYRGSTVLTEVSLIVDEGELAALVGRNGVGKTTLVRCISGELRPNSGAILFRGQDVTKWPMFRRARAGLRYVPDDRGLCPNLTVAENLRLASLYALNSHGDDDKQRVKQLFPILVERSRQLAGLLSGGEQRMLAIARVLLAAPQLVIIDEFSEGLQPSIVQQIAEALVAANDAGLAVVLVEQNVHLALKLATRAYVMDKGRIVYHGESDALLADDAVLREHLVI